MRSAIGGTATLPLTAEGLIPVVLALVGSGDMGLVDLGASGSVTFKVKNIGTERTGTLTYTIPSPFTYSSRPGNLDECREATQLDPGQECEIMATLSSSDDAGKKMATATISATPGGSLSVPLTAEVARVIEATIAGLPYGDDIVLPGLQTVADIKKTVTLKNVSQTTLSNVKLFNENAGWLHTSIGACSGSLGPGESCTLSVYADAADAHYGESQRLRFSINAAGYHTFHVGAWYSALQTNVAHLQVRNGRDLVITNVGNHQVLQPNIVISDGGYSLASNSCRGSLDPGQSCIVRIVHDPMTWQSGTITVGTAAEGSFSVYLEP